MSTPTERASASVLLLARDETADIETLLPLLDFASEVVVVWDPRGDAATRAAAERLGARVFAHEWAGFGTQRAFALQQCSADWVLWLDADERLDARARAAVIAATSRAGAAGPVQYSIARVNLFLGKRIRFCGWQGERVVRLFRRAAARFDDALVHERVHVTGAAATPLPGVIEHQSYRTLADCEAKLERYAEANAAQAWRAGRRAGSYDVMLRPVLRFVRQYVLQLGFLDGAAGLQLCRYAAAQVRRKYLLLRERTLAERAAR